MSEKTVLLSALKATSQNIVEEFAKEREGEDGRRGEGEGERVGDGEGGETVEEDDEMRPGVVEKVCLIMDCTMAVKSDRSIPICLIDHI